MSVMTFAEKESGAVAMLVCLGVGVLCFIVYGLGYLHGERNGYAKRTCTDRGFEYQGYEDLNSHRFARCVDREQNPIIVKVW